MQGKHNKSQVGHFEEPNHEDTVECDIQETFKMSNFVKWTRILWAYVVVASHALTNKQNAHVVWI